MDGMAFQARDMIARDSNCDRKAEYKNGRETSAGQPRAWRQKQQQPQSPGLSRWFVVMRRSLLVACALVGLSWQLPGIQRRYTNDTGVGPLRFADDGTFQVSVFEDLHFGESKNQ
jgi:hypothetical protein